MAFSRGLPPEKELSQVIETLAAVEWQRDWDREVNLGRISRSRGDDMDMTFATAPGHVQDTYREQAREDVVLVLGHPALWFNRPSRPMEFSEDVLKALRDEA